MIPCEICRDPSRDKGLICVVEDVADYGRWNAAMHFAGSIMFWRKPYRRWKACGQSIYASILLTRLKDNNVREVILALNATVEGKPPPLCCREKSPPWASPSPNSRTPAGRRRTRLPRRRHPDGGPCKARRLAS